MDNSKFSEGSWHKRNGFKNQYERTYRWLVRLQDIEAGTFNSVRQDFSLQRDFLLAFFTASFSIRDWVKGEPQWEKISHLVDRNIQLMLCRDIANGSKHMILNNPSVDEDFGFATKVGPDGHKIAFKVSSQKVVKALETACEKLANKHGAIFDVTVLHKDLSSQGIPTTGDFPLFMDAMKLANDCLMAWEDYLEMAELISKEEIVQIKENAFHHKGF